jgi:hypothetical protein
MTLSDKGKPSVGLFEEPSIMYSEKDVKEFIKEIKKGWAATSEIDTKLFVKLQKQLDNLAGEKLI